MIPVRENSEVVIKFTQKTMDFPIPLGPLSKDVCLANGFQQELHLLPDLLGFMVGILWFNGGLMEL